MYGGRRLASGTRTPVAGLGIFETGGQVMPGLGSSPAPVDAA